MGLFDWFFGDHQDTRTYIKPNYSDGETLYTTAREKDFKTKRGHYIQISKSGDTFTVDAKEQKIIAIYNTKQDPISFQQQNKPHNGMFKEIPDGFHITVTGKAGAWEVQLDPDPECLGCCF